MTEKHVLTGVCPRMVSYDIEDGKLKNLKFKGGCEANLKAIGILVEDKPIEDVINTIGGLNCGKKGTSCTNELCKLLAKEL